MTVEAGPEAQIQLSICIPTYNFGEFIGETLESILPQIVEGVEVVILDGGSTDDTPAVVRTFQERFPALHYHRRDERGGIDRDMARTVEFARGEYCWLFSSDDLMKPDAIRQVLEQIKSGLDVYLCGLTICTRDMHPVKEHHILSVRPDTTFDLGREDDRRTYFERAETTTAFFSFLGSVIFKKARWDAIPLDEEFVGSCWAHVARLFRMIPSGLRVKYLRTSYLWKRSDNDSFMDAGLIQRYAISIDGYHRLARTFFGQDSFEARHIRRVVATEFQPRAMLYAKMKTRDASPEGRLMLERLAQAVYEDPSLRNWLFRAVYRWTPVLLFKALATPYLALLKALKRR
ncbi:MAG TPA: glycosyltransferase family A protein [Solirubrobacteraceae bacterium]|jgi:abequosyltransferase|nr:glycosyltransferase family A protein [Solirubrobacteraceae bacterium]